MHSLSSGISILLLVTSGNLRGTISFVPPSLTTLKKVSDPKSRLLYKSSSITPPAPVATVTATPVRLKKEKPPMIIQGGMGVRISSWNLAREVSKRGGLGVISGTAMDIIFVRELQDGDPGGHFRRALASFPNQDMAQHALVKYFVPDGKLPTKPYRSLPSWTLSPARQLEEATILGNYCEVWLAKHNDDGSPTGGLVGMNLLTKVSLPTIHSLYGAMLADVDYVIMGAGIPSKIPGILDALAEHHDCSLPIDITGATSDDYAVTFSPNQFWKGTTTSDMAKKQLNRPSFLPIVSSTTLAQSLLKRSNGSGPTRGVDGFVVELPTAGGHNAPPRGWHYDPSDQGEPMYGVKDVVDIKSFAKVAKGLPFWFAGEYGRPDKLCDVLDAGGNGVQVGTLFALSDESGMESTMKQGILAQLAQHNKLNVITDPAASPTGFPFKVLELEDGPSTPSLKTLSDPEVYNARPRICNLGYLRSAYIDADGKVGYRCPAESVADFVSKGGDKSETAGRKCLCNALCADAGFPQVRHIINPLTGEKDLYVEPSLVTLGDDVNQCATLLKKKTDGTWGYSASDAMDYLLSDWKKSQRQGKKQQDLVNPVRWGYSPAGIADYLLSEYNEFQKQMQEDPALMIV
mmetsp:Transcript_3424/g.7540  ORF Transcript_3424/g.7540 Transcript_3424/m.7540 type:complete len:631 (+) Transcript_3424:674-2566(+)|eukprot:CAMPEP_0172326336 /NCGR_PEP_ID=MMETSP1058-20130122/56204_1 /TAXON_ID=83371 /ORGANISM="Detonula confervacea, Strain CCMP 353" /LENGTH=630 /DNA_ID=CAMNT_0013043093 /DNA_START=564 /DNA_END=2456 /DNA_ORIENTATION=-